MRPGGEPLFEVYLLESMIQETEPTGRLRLVIRLKPSQEGEPDLDLETLEDALRSPETWLDKKHETEPERLDKTE